MPMQVEDGAIFFLLFGTDDLYKRVSFLLIGYGVFEDMSSLSADWSKGYSVQQRGDDGRAYFDLKNGWSEDGSRVEKVFGISRQ